MRVGERTQNWRTALRQRRRTRSRRCESETSSDGATASRDRIRLLTYNIHRAIGLDRRFRPDRIAHLLAAHDADIVLLQEVDEGVPRSREMHLARELAQALDYPFYAMGHNVSVRKGGYYGNATLSRFAIERERNIDLTIGRRKRRGCQHTTIRLPAAAGARAIEVFNLHLGLSAIERYRQVELLARSPELSHLDRNQACVIGGDFNDWRSLLRPFLTEVCDFGCATDRSTRLGPRALRTYPSISPRGGLDKLFYRGGLRLRSVYPCRHDLARVASDHLPVIATFDLAEAGQQP